MKPDYFKFETIYNILIGLKKGIERIEKRQKATDKRIFKIKKKLSQKRT